MVVINIALSLALFPSLGHVAIALATSVSAWVNVVLLAGTQWRRGDFRPDGATVKRVILLIISAALMGGFLMIARVPLAEFLQSGTFILKLVSLTGLIGSATLIYFAIVILTGAMDRSLVKRLLRRNRAA